MNSYRKSIESIKAYLNAIPTHFEKLSKLSLKLIGLVSVAFIGVLDYLTGYEISLTVFYLIPISIVTWFAGKRSGVLISIGSAIAIYIADILAGKVFSTFLIFLWDAFITLGLFFVVVFSLSALEKSLGRYRTLIETSPDPIVMYSLSGNILAANAQAAEVYGVSSVAALFKEVKTVFDLLTEEGKAFAADNLRRTLMEGHSQKNEYLLRAHDGRVIPVEINTSVLQTVPGEPRALISVIRDITDRKRAEEALRESELKYRTLVEATHDYVFMVDRKGLLTYVNPNFEKATGYSLSDLKGHPFTIVIAPGERKTIIDRFKKGVRGAPSLPYETELLGKEGKRLEVEFLAYNLCDDSGNVTGRFGVGRDITKRKEMEALLRDSEKRYRELSIVDDLTQLYNSRHFYFQLKREIDRSNRYGQPLTLILLDLDNFKAFNDAYGHVEGDQVLLRLGQVTKRCLRQTDSAYRYGGEEFTILLPVTTSQEGAVTAERIRTEFNKERFSPESGKEIHVTVSIGFAQYKPQEDMKAFVHRVDQLMYLAKKNGKDRACSEQ
jgi:diguanylate cyclase (GGDEF)-like protein/PAS domain S-box-containing protein